MPPLPSILTVDKPIIMNILDCFLIPNDKDHRFIHTDENEDITQKELNKSMVVIYRMANKYSAEGKTFQLLVIYGGHGAGHEQKQMCILNNEDPKKAFYALEEKIRKAVSTQKSLRVLSLLDCCSVVLPKYEGLW